MSNGSNSQALSKRQQGKLPSNNETNPKENVQTITTRSEIQLPEIIMVRSKAQTGKTPIEENGLVQKLSVNIEISKESELESSASKVPTPVKAYVPYIPFSQRLQKHKLDAKFSKFLEVFKKPHITFANALAQMPSYGTFMKHINLILLSIFRKLGLGEAKTTIVSLQLDDRSIKYPWGVIEDVLVEVDKI